MLKWNLDVDGAPRDGSWVLIITEHDEPACVYWQVDDDGTEFGWTHDGGDRYSPKAWCPLTGLNGEALRRR